MEGEAGCVVILGRGVLLTAFAMIYFVWMLAYNGDNKNLLAIAIAVIACILMILVERRFGLVGGLAGIVITVTHG